MTSPEERARKVRRWYDPEIDSLGDLQERFAAEIRSAVEEERERCAEHVFLAMACGCEDVANCPYEQHGIEDAASILGEGDEEEGREAAYALADRIRKDRERYKQALQPAIREGTNGE